MLLILVLVVFDALKTDNAGDNYYCRCMLNECMRICYATKEECSYAFNGACQEVHGTTRRGPRDYCVFRRLHE